MSKPFRKYRTRSIALAIEGAYNDGSTTVNQTADAIEVVDLEIFPLEGDTVTHNINRPGLGGFASVIAGEHSRVTFKVGFASSGTAGEAPAWGKLLRSCGLAEVNEASRVSYVPIDSNEESIVIYCVIDGALHKMSGVHSKFTLELAPKSLPYMSFECMGIFHAVEAQTNPAVNLSAFTLPVPVSAQVTTLSLLGMTPAVQTFSLDSGVEMSHQTAVGCESVYITNRVVTGSITIDAQDLDVANTQQMVLNSTTGSLAVVHGVTAGRTMELRADNVQLTNYQYANNDNKLGETFNLSFLPSDTGDYQIIAR